MAKLVGSNLDFNNVSKIVNLPNPVSPQDAVTKAYADALSEGNSWKDSARVSTQANVNLASPGATIDGVTLVSGDRVLVRNQTTQSQNGIYIWTGASSAMTRSNDANTADELEMATLFVEEGTDAGAKFRQTQINFTLGTGNVLFVADSSAAPAASESTAGIAEIATQAETDAGTDDLRIVTPLKLKNYSGRKFKAVADIGDGSATSFAVNHNFNTRDVLVTVFPNSGNYDDILCDVQRTSVNQVTLVFSSAPASNGFRVVILA